MLGICGAGMGALACLLQAKGYVVTGSDKASLPPMSIQLKDMGIDVMIGFNAKNLMPRPDLVVIGNVISKDNPEAEAVVRDAVPYLSMPETIKRFFLGGRKSLVVTGTHGKTTTSNILAWILERAGKSPSFMAGGAGLNFEKSYRLSSGDHFVIEGDEYDTAFFDKGPKFLHYNPFAAIINAIEFDHADIYTDLNHIKDSFKRLVAIMPADGILVANADYDNVLDVIKDAACRITTFGFSEKADYQIVLELIEEEYIHFYLKHGSKTVRLSSPLMGKHNMGNAAAAVALLLELGIKEKDIVEGLKTFKGVRKRQEIRSVVSDITIIDDFAHHPTAISGAIEAVKMRYKSNRVWAIFEPRSNTTRRNFFQKDITRALSQADKSIITAPYHGDDIPKTERLDAAGVASAINNLCPCGNKSYYIPDTDSIVEFLVRTVIPGDVVLIMSNGDFDGIHEKIIEGLKRRRFTSEC